MEHCRICSLQSRDGRVHGPPLSRVHRIEETQVTPMDETQINESPFGEEERITRTSDFLLLERLQALRRQIDRTFLLLGGTATLARLIWMSTEVGRITERMQNQDGGETTEEDSFTEDERYD